MIDRFFAWLREKLGIARLEKHMGQLEDLVTAMDAETNEVAARLDKLTAELAATVAANQAPSQATLDHLAAISARLKTLGQDPANPIPPAPAPASP